MNMILRNEKGSAILIALSLMLMLTVVGLMAVNTSTLDVELSFHKAHGEKAFYIADAGAKCAYAEILADSLWNTGFSDITFNGGTYTVQVADSSTDSTLADTIIFTSTGFYDAVKAVVEITVIPEIDYPFRKALFGDDEVDIRNSMETDSYNSDSGTYAATLDTLGGDIGSNGTISVANGAIISGDVITSLVDGADVNEGATVTGEIRDDSPEQEIEGVPQSEFDLAEVNNDAATGISGSYSYTPSTGDFQSSGDVTFSDGVYFFSSITLMNSANLIVAPGAEVTIYVTGDVELKNSAAVNVGGVPANLIIYSQGDFVLKNSGDIYAVFHSPDGTADLRNSGDFYGAIVADDIVAHNSAGFHYDRSLADFDRGKTGDIDIVAWREL